jgi:hypothetical protein
LKKASKIFLIDSLLKGTQKPGGKTTGKPSAALRKPSDKS